MLSLQNIFFAFCGFLIAALIFGSGNAALDASNSIEFCTSCHSMNISHEEYKESIHYKNRSGVTAICSDCHVPKKIGPKLWAKILAVKDIYHEIIGTIDDKEKFEARRWEMANRVWRKMRNNDSQECRNCHQFSAMDLAEQDSIARKKHFAAQAKGKTCIDCHQGIAHETPDEPDTGEKIAL